MITKFKLYESDKYYDEDDLIDYLDEDLIIEWYDEGNFIDLDELAYICTDCIWDNFDKNRFVKDFINDMKIDRTYDDFDTDDYIEYIKSNLTKEKKEKIIALYKENIDDEDEDNQDDYFEFDMNYLYDFDKDQLIEIIEEDSSEYDFVDYITEYMYDGYSADDIFSDFFGVSYTTKFENQDNFYNKQEYVSFGDFLVKNYSKYIDEKDAIKDFNRNIYIEDKKESAKENIYNVKDFQRNILNNNNDIVLVLSELFEYNDGENIGGEYDFQKIYIEKYVEEYADDDADSIFEETATALEYLNDNYKLNDKIEKEYRDIDSGYFYKIDTQKYNI